MLHACSYLYHGSHASVAGRSARVKKAGRRFIASVENKNLAERGDYHRADTSRDSDTGALVKLRGGDKFLTMTRLEPAIPGSGNRYLLH